MDGLIAIGLVMIDRPTKGPVTVDPVAAGLTAEGPMTVYPMAADLTTEGPMTVDPGAADLTAEGPMTADPAIDDRVTVDLPTADLAARKGSISLAVKSLWSPGLCRTISNGSSRKPSFQTRISISSAIPSPRTV